MKTIHLQPLGDDGGCDELVGGDLLVQLVVGALVKQHQVVQLVPENKLESRERSDFMRGRPGLSLGPLLLLGLAASSLLLLGGL